MPVSLKELEFIHNYALKLLAERKFKDSFWSTSPAGWKSAFGKPNSLDQLIDRPDKISTMFSEEEEEWFTATIEHFVSNKTAEQLADLGITDAQLEQLQIPKPNLKAATASGKPGKVKTTPFCNICEPPGADVCSFNFAAAGHRPGRSAGVADRVESDAR